MNRKSDLLGALTLQGPILISFLILRGKANLHLTCPKISINLIIFNNLYKLHLTRNYIISEYPKMSCMYVPTLNVEKL